MKVKLISGAQAFEERINDFIKDKKVIDIRYQEEGYPNISALIMYEDQQDSSNYKFIDVIDDESEDKKCPYCDLKNDLYKRSFLDTRGISANGPYYMSIVHDFIDTHFVIMSELPSSNKASNGQGNSILIHYCPMCGRKL